MKLLWDEVDAENRVVLYSETTGQCFSMRKSSLDIFHGSFRLTPETVLPMAYQIMSSTKTMHPVRGDILETFCC